MTSAETPTMFDLPPEKPLPPPPVMAPGKLTLTIEGSVDFARALVGKEETITGFMLEGLERGEAAFRVVFDHYNDILRSITQADGVEATTVESWIDYDWSDELVTDLFAAMTPRYPKRFVGDA